ncbi:MAG: tRNA 2-selenouridine(34) synthase MnmH [Pseudomonadota bacterium]
MFTPTILSDLHHHGFDTVIDVRSPAEFAEDHIPGAINLPVLNDEERARVGTIYKQVAPFEARKIGAALVFQNAARHINTALKDRDGAWRPLVYCWRGGQRSGSFGWMLREIGWRAEVLKGGYKTYRSKVVSALYDGVLPHRLVRLGGYTGTAKTELLDHLTGFGVQTIDLEALAHHRGSLLGGMTKPQPSQKAFETALAECLSACDPKHPVVVEAESSKIGSISLPPALWSAMTAAPMIEVAAPLEARAAYLATAYDSVLADGPALKDKLSPLRRFRGHAVVDHWNDLIDTGAHLALCRSLAADHYDPAYDKSAAGTRGVVIGRLCTDSLDAVALERLAKRIALMVQEKVT